MSLRMNPIKLLINSIPFACGWAAVPALFTGTAATATAAATAGLIGAGGVITSGALFSGIATGLSIFSTISGGIQQSNDLKAQANAEKFNARTREIDRKKNLIRALALQNVRQGSGGIQGGIGSSAQAIQLSDIRDFELDQSADRAGTSQRVNQLRSNAKSATTFSLLSAAGEGAGAFARYKKRGTTDKKRGTP